MYRPGMVFRHTMNLLDTKGKDLYLLAQVDNAMMSLVSLHDSNRITSPVKVGSAYRITQEEFNQIAGAWKGELELFDGTARLVQRLEHSVTVVTNQVKVDGNS